MELGIRLQVLWYIYHASIAVTYFPTQLVIGKMEVEDIIVQFARFAVAQPTKVSRLKGYSNHRPVVEKIAKEHEEDNRANLDYPPGWLVDSQGAKDLWNSVVKSYLETLPAVAGSTAAGSGAAEGQELSTPSEETVVVKPEPVTPPQNPTAQEAGQPHTPRTSGVPSLYLFTPTDQTPVQGDSQQTARASTSSEHIFSPPKNDTATQSSVLDVVSGMLGWGRRGSNDTNSSNWQSPVVDAIAKGSSNLQQTFTTELDRLKGHPEATDLEKLQNIIIKDGALNPTYGQIAHGAKSVRDLLLNAEVIMGRQGELHSPPLRPVQKFVLAEQGDAGTGGQLENQTLRGLRELGSPMPTRMTKSRDGPLKSVEEVPSSPASVSTVMGSFQTPEQSATPERSASPEHVFDPSRIVSSAPTTPSPGRKTNTDTKLTTGAGSSSTMVVDWEQKILKAIRDKSRTLPELLRDRLGIDPRNDLAILLKIVEWDDNVFTPEIFKIEGHSTDLTDVVRKILKQANSVMEEELVKSIRFGQDNIYRCFNHAIDWSLQTERSASDLTRLRDMIITNGAFDPFYLRMQSTTISGLLEEAQKKLAWRLEAGQATNDGQSSASGQVEESPETRGQYQAYVSSDTDSATSASLVDGKQILPNEFSLALDPKATWERELLRAIRTRPSNLQELLSKRISLEPDDWQLVANLTVLLKLDKVADTFSFDLFPSETSTTINDLMLAIFRHIRNSVPVIEDDVAKSIQSGQNVVKVVNSAIEVMELIQEPVADLIALRKIIIPKGAFDIRYAGMASKTAITLLREAERRLDDMNQTARAGKNPTQPSVQPQPPVQPQSPVQPQPLVQPGGFSPLDLVKIALTSYARDKQVPALKSALMRAAQAGIGSDFKNQVDRIVQLAAQIRTVPIEVSAARQIRLIVQLLERGLTVPPVTSQSYSQPQPLVQGQYQPPAPPVTSQPYSQPLSPAPPVTSQPYSQPLPPVQGHYQLPPPVQNPPYAPPGSALDLQKYPLQNIDTPDMPPYPPPVAIEISDIERDYPPVPKGFFPVERAQTKGERRYTPNFDIDKWRLQCYALVHYGLSDKILEKTAVKNPHRPSCFSPCGPFSLDPNDWLQIQDPDIAAQKLIWVLRHGKDTSRRVVFEAESLDGRPFSRCFTLPAITYSKQETKNIRQLPSDGNLDAVPWRSGAWINNISLTITKGAQRDSGRLVQVLTYDGWMWYPPTTCKQYAGGQVIQEINRLR
jgi:hypothetical protein